MGIIGIYDTLNNRVANHIAGEEVSETDFFDILEYITGVNQARLYAARKIYLRHIAGDDGG